MSPLLFLSLAIASPFAALCIWIYFVFRTLMSASMRATELNPLHLDEGEVRKQAAELSKNPLNISYLPPATGRRYVIVGGSGFVGGWIVRHLLLRGEDPKNIRIINKRPPVRKDIQPEGIGFVSADITNAHSVRSAFMAEWPRGSNTTARITVFHTASVMRYYERQKALISRSSGVNVDGTENVIASAKAAGADILIYTSSGSLPLCRTSFWFLPWKRCPETVVQVLNDTTPIAEEHDGFFSNYPYTKALAEKLVRDSHNPEAGFRTGILRPGAAIYGRGDGMSFDGLLSKMVNPSWMHSTVQSVIYVENASYAHLLYESRLLESQSASPTSPLHRLGGQAFMVTDGSNPVLYGDVYRALGTLTNNRVEFPRVPIGPILLVVQLLGFYHSLQAQYPRWLPPLQGGLARLQPPLLDLTLVSFKVDDSRARLPPEEGGLGYQPPWTTLQGICEVVNKHRRGEPPSRKYK
ncbi:hypothetical protein NLJ89_g2939 [Agrocybe chaxingu]|uniref:3-beta hydroxysteroid dehydrogenase/isomerase domain-containing protein n=1 Tax=Agrocybe chaxingu TaxID=84603 RepID=A0A9W8MYP3_9AGAR|nr:hypothetical protein NLJ89_g2939 [Agrocybe chaxingu]